MMKYLLFLMPFIIHAQSSLMILMGDDFSYQDETLAYQARVEADGGEVKNLDDIDAFYVDAKANNYLDTLTVALLYTGGVKLSGAVITKWYDLSPNENDFITYYGLDPNYSAINGVGGGTTPDFGASLTFTQPNSYYFIMMRAVPVGNIWGGAGYQSFLEGADNSVIIYAGSSVQGTTVYTTSVFELFRCVFNGASSSIQKNNGTPDVGDAGAQGVNTDFLFFNTVSNTYFKAFVITKMLSSTKDLALKNILNTIYPTY